MRQIDRNQSMKYALNILKRFDYLCNKYNLRYSVAFGTMIGCVRHKGLIPWDDDIDVMMPRGDYEKLMNMRYKEYPYEIRSYRYTKGYYYPFAKMIDMRTRIKEPNRCETDMGLYLDIFPYDYLPEGYDFSKRSQHKILADRYRLITIGLSLKNTSLKRPLLRKILRAAYFWLIHPFRKIILKKGENKYIKVEKTDSNLTMCLFSTVEKGACISENEWNDTLYMPFEDFQVSVVSVYDRVLKALYGDYMIPPPENERVSPHNLCVWVND